jgi:mRNA-decapping enzyme subunit 2
LIRLFFQIELAHWFFLDFFCTQEENAIFSCGIKHFATEIFLHIPFLSHHLPNLTNIVEEWRKYKMSVPTYGAILLTQDMKHCLLVQSFFAKNSWSFPKGKVNQDEDPVKCAIREVYEETGFDCGHLINGDDYLEGQTSNYQYTRLYIVKNVPIETKFCPKTRNEIKDCSWFVIDLLPTNRNDDGYLRVDRKIRANSFYMILPFISKLKRWIAIEQGMLRSGQNKKKLKHNQHNGVRIQNGKKNNKNQMTTQSPFFTNNLDYHQKNGRTSKHKAMIDEQMSVTGTFYNDYAKLQENSSTPISTNNSTFFHSNSSAFRSTNNSDNINKKKQQKFNSNSNDKNQISQKKLFNKNEMKENNLTTIKPFTMEIPDCWMNFKFDRQKLLDCIYK